jgi:phospholipid transport system substrate-binding protein
MLSRNRGGRGPGAARIATSLVSGASGDPRRPGGNDRVTARRRWSFATAFALAVWLSSPASTGADTDTHAASAVVEALHEELLEVMKQAEQLGYEGRYEKLEPVLQQLFDTSFMAEKSVGRHWKKIEDPKREKLRQTFRRFTIANYAGRFNGYSGERFETLREEPSTHGTILVHSHLIESGGDVVQLNYRLHPVDDEWRIFDVYLNGTVSELALRRSEYSSLIQRDGLDALIVALEEKIDELATSAPTDER